MMRVDFFLKWRTRGIDFADLIDILSPEGRILLVESANKGQL
jgi:hypothetical protein